jgi:hypothetical protein
MKVQKIGWLLRKFTILKDGTIQAFFITNDREAEYALTLKPDEAKEFQRRFDDWSNYISAVVFDHTEGQDVIGRPIWRHKMKDGEIEALVYRGKEEEKEKDDEA